MSFGAQAQTSDDSCRRLILYSAHDGEQVDLFVMETDGSQVRRLTNTEERELGYSWSPDGNRIVFADSNFVEDYSHLFVLDVTTLEITQLTPPSMYVPARFVWSPYEDVLYLVASVSDERSDLYKYDFHTAEFQNLTNSSEQTEAIVYVIQGRYLIYNISDDRTNWLAHFDMLNNQTERLVEWNSRYSFESFNLLMENENSRDTGVYDVVNVLTLERSILDMNHFVFQGVAWSPSSEYVALSNGVGYSVDHSVLLMNVNNRQSMMFEQGYRASVWSPNSQYLLLWHNIGSIQMFDTVSASLTEVATEVWHDPYSIPPVWSPESDSFLYLSLTETESPTGVHEYDIYSYNLETNSVTNLTNSSLDEYVPVFSPCLD
ncbi:MAG: hypothetical protein RLP44_15620 [Aggregatilineales bacterium]